MAAENFIEIIQEIRGSTLDPATDVTCIYGDIKQMHFEYQGFSQITPEERAKLGLIEPEATKNQSDAYLLNRTNHIGTQSADSIIDGISRVAMTVAERTKLNGISDGATANATDADLRNRATHTGTQSIDTIVNSATNVKMTVEERAKLFAIEDDATKNDTNSQLRDRSTHTGTQSADTITPGSTNGVFTLVEKSKLATLNSMIDNAHIIDVNWNKLTNVPLIFSPSAHTHNMSEITAGNLSATRINETLDLQFVDSAEKSRIADAEILSNKGVPYGYAPLDGNGKINGSYLNDLNLVDVFTPETASAMLLLTSAQPGDIAYVQDTQDSYMLIGLPSNIINNWKKLNSSAGVVSINGQIGVVSISTDDIPEGIVNKYYTEERVDDRVNGLLKAGTNISLVYDDGLNELTINANDTSVEWSEVQNKPDPTVSVNISGDISGSGSVTLTDLADGTLNITNMTLESTGTAGTYRSVTTDANGRVVSGTNPTTISGYEITDAYTKTEINDIANTKQDTLISGTNIKSINNTSVLGSGNLEITVGSGGYAANVYLTTLVSSTVGTYNQISYTPQPTETILSATVNNNEVLLADYIFDGDVRATAIPAGEWGFHFHTRASSNVATSFIRFELFKRSALGVETVLFSKLSDEINNLAFELSTILVTQPAYVVSEDDRIGIKVYASTTRTSNVVIDFIVGDGGAAYFTTPLEIRHNQLRARDEVDSHPIAAITNLQTELDNRVIKNANITAGTYKSVTVDAKGLVTAGTNPTTLSGFGITDAYTKTEIDSVNLLRADKYLASQNIANMIYSLGDLTKIRYNNDTDVDYEVLAYTGGNLTSIQHYVGSVLKGTTTLSYTSGNLVSAIFVGA